MSGAGASARGSWWGRARGCGCAVTLSAVAALVGGWVATTRPLYQEIQVRRILDERYGPQEGFTPPADGAVPAERMQVFLAVRERLAGPCARLAESLAASDRVERFEWVEDPSRQELFGALWKTGRAALALEKRRGELLRDRDQALVDVGMGLGEYSYIYAVAYGAHLVSHREVDERLPLERAPLLPRVRELLRDALQRQLAAVEVSTRSSGGGDGWAEMLAAEVARLEEDPRRIPWMEGLPPQIEASVAPFRDRLEALSCGAALGLELSRNERQGISIHTH